MFLLMGIIKDIRLVVDHIDVCDLIHVRFGPYLYKYFCLLHGIVQELCESRGGRPELSVLTSLLVSVDVKLY